MFDPEELDTDESDLYTEAELTEACALTRSQAFQKGLDAGRARQREETLGMLEMACAFNGSGAKVLDTLRKAWSESAHPRGEAGKFARAPGTRAEDYADPHPARRDAGLPAGSAGPADEIADLEGKLRAQHTARAAELQASADSGRAALEQEMRESGMAPDHPLAQMMLAQIALLEQYARERRELAVGKPETFGKAHPGTDDPPATNDDDDADPDDDDATPLADDPDSARELLAAAVAHTEACLADGRDPQPGLDALDGLAGAELEEVADGTFEKAWDESLHPRSRNGRFIGRDRIQAAQSDPKKANELRAEVDPKDADKLEDALSGKSDVGKTARGAAKHAAKEKREARHASRAEALKIRNRLFGQHQRDEALDPADLRALVPHLSTMTQSELSDVRLFLAGAGASFGGKRLRQERVERLTEWANAQADGAQVEAVKEEPKPEEKPAATEQTHDIDDVAKILGVSHRTVAMWVDRGRIKGERDPVTGNRTIRRSDLDTFLSEHGMPSVEASAVKEAADSRARRAERDAKVAARKPKKDATPPTAASAPPAPPADAAPAAAAKPATVDPVAVYDRAGSTAPHSEVNAALRAVAQMTAKEASAALTKLDHAVTANPRKQLAELIYDRKSSQIRGLHAGLGREADARVQAQYKPLNDEPLLSVEEAFAAAEPAKEKTPRGKEPKPAATPATPPADVVRQAIGDAVRSGTFRGRDFGSGDSHRVPMSHIRAALTAAGHTDREAQDEAILDATHRDESARGKHRLADVGTDQFDTGEAASAIRGGGGAGRFGNVVVPGEHATHWTDLTPPAAEKTPRGKKPRRPKKPT